MDINEHTTPAKLERYAFLWSLGRMVVASLSLFFGAMPILYSIPVFSGMSSSYTLLNVAWIISGAASIYLAHLWFKNDKKVFGSDDKRTTILFAVMLITGINLGYAAMGPNVGMDLAGDIPLIFKATAILYLYVAYMLWEQWKDNGEQLFPSAGAPTSVDPMPDISQSSGDTSSQA